MTSLARLKEAAQALEAQRPDIDVDAAGYWSVTAEINEINAEIARESDKARAWRKATGFKVT